MQISKIEESIIKIIVDDTDYNLDEYYDNLVYLEKQKILTFGDTNFRILENFFKKNDFATASLDLCLADDEYS